jgi:Ni/Co efflux regulator RcnB
MITKRLSLIAVAAAFAVSSSAALLQSSRPALADADDHHPRMHRPHNDGDHDRDDRRPHRAGYHWVNGQWVPNNNVANANGHWVNGQWVPNNGNWSAHPGKHNGWKHKKHHDRD